MMKRVKRLGMLVMMMAATMTVGAQDNVEATVSADVVNQYIWRGTEWRSLYPAHPWCEL